MKVQLPKGTRDVKPEEKIVKNRIVSVLTTLFERYGFAPLETPIFERFDVLASKYTGGSEILKETFKLTDQGKRELALRYDLTVPLARYVAMDPTIKMPFKRYQIGPVFRDGPVATARYRQFTQCDVDVVGSKSQVSDADCIALCYSFFSEVGLDAEIRVNNRKVLDEILSTCGVKNNNMGSVLLTLDKLLKVGEKGVRAELIEKGISSKIIDEIFSFISVSGLNMEKVSFLREKLGESEGIKEIEELLSLVEVMGAEVVFDVTLARGLAYYTGTIYEVGLRNSSITSSVAAGGRYDKMIGDLIGRGEYPAVGISFGIDRIYDAVVEKEKTSSRTPLDVFVIPIKTLTECLPLVRELRDAGINCDVDVLGRNITKNLKYVNTFGIPFALIVGEDELKARKYSLKDMTSGEEEKFDVRGVVARILKK